MSTKQSTCPNCGFQTSLNYCAQCGQKNNLHKETFIQLVFHFIEHYFHYDNKFFKTVSALFLKPGKLTLAYWKNERMRYIPPISLYIFMSAVFFISSSLLPVESTHMNNTENAKVETESITQTPLPSDDSGISYYRKEIRKKLQIMDSDSPEAERLIDQLVNWVPKIFFFMIPVMGLIMTLIFFKRKELYFVDHSIFCLHYHSFWFGFITIFNIPFIGEAAWIPLIIAIISMLYFIISIRNVYKIGWFKSTLASLFTGAIYLFVFLIAFFSLIIYIH